MTIENVTNTKIINGEFVIYYSIENETQIEQPYTHLTPYAKAIIEFPGLLWIRALKLLVLPLITMMMIVLPGRVSNVGPIGKIAIPLYLLTSTCAAIQGTIWAWVIQPGNLGKADYDSIISDLNVHYGGGSDYDNIKKEPKMETILKYDNDENDENEARAKQGDDEKKDPPPYQTPPSQNQIET